MHTKRNRDITDVNINLNKNKIKQVSTVKYLGIQLNENVSTRICQKKRSTQIRYVESLSNQIARQIPNKI